MLDCFREYVADPDEYRRRWGEQFWVILDQQREALLGECAIVEKEIEGITEYDLGYFLFPHAWGHGYALESAHRVVRIGLAEFGLPSLIAIIHAENLRSQATARRIGMDLEREVTRPNGEQKLLFRLSEVAAA